MSTTTVNADRLLTLAEAGNVMRVSRSTLDRLLRSGDAPSVCRISGRTLRIPESGFRKWLEGRMQ